jgi:hypothetical protein
LKKLIFLIITINAGFVFSQINSELFPGNLNIQPFVANFLEPKVGTVFQLGNNELELDIGNSLDIIHIEKENSTYSAGADFFTYTLLRREQNFHFPVDAVDYLFGINFGYKTTINNNELGLRFRLSHISAHLVDGRVNRLTGKWLDGKYPKVYSREFIEIFPYIRFNDLRTYFGYTYIFHIDPANLGKHSFQFGFDYFFNNILSQYFQPFIGYDFNLININKYSGNNSLYAGIKMGSAAGRGLSIYYNYYSGKNIHGEFFDYNENYSAIGFNLDL